MAKRLETSGMDFREPKKLFLNENKKYSNFLDIWYENHRI